uniref:Putative secreted protein n=1 Tax=Amblyomma parvum TaxID=251391 RepID=A0A023G072_AMBPA
MVFSQQGHSSIVVAMGKVFLWHRAAAAIWLKVVHSVSLFLLICFFSQLCASFGQCAARRQLRKTVCVCS